MRIPSVLALIALTLALPAAAADGPNLLNYQGVLRDSAGAPRQGTFDMRFRFFDAATLGGELLIDEHLAAGTGGVVVSGGLFNVALGSGTVLDGGSPGTFANLREVVAAHSAVWLEIQIGGETLAPRVRLLAAAYALNATSSANASLLDSLDSTQFLRSDADDVFTSGTLTTAVGTILDLRGDTRVNGKLFMNHQGPDANQLISFYDGGSPNGESFGWSEALDRFTLSNTLHVAGQLQQAGTDMYINSSGPDATQSLYFFDTGEPTGQSISWDNPAGRFYLSDDVYADGTMTVAGPTLNIGSAGPEQSQRINFFDNGSAAGQFLMWDNAQDRYSMSNDLSVLGDVRLQREITFSGGGADGNQTLRFFEDGIESGETVTWDDAQDRFEITDDLAIQGVIRTGTTGVAPVTYNTIGSGTATSADITNILDLLVSGDVEVGDQMYMGGENLLEWSTVNNYNNFHFNAGVHIGDGVTENLMVGGNRLFLQAGAVGGNPQNYFEFAVGTFYMSDDLDVQGTLTAGSKNFVQNHPYDPSLEVVYTTLEGPEAATFTRGSARLVAGRATVPLESTFALVTHPDLGLTVALTPRGAWADLYVEAVTTTELVVAAAAGSPQDAAFDYHVMGLRVGYEESPTLRPKRRDAPLPEPAKLLERIAERPELASTTPLARYRSTESEVFGRRDVQLSAGNALRAAIGTSEKVASAGKWIPEATDLAVPQQAAAPRAPKPMSAPTAPATDRRHAPRAEEGSTAPTGWIRPGAPGIDAIAPSVGTVKVGDVLALDTATGGVRRANQAQDGTVVGIATGDGSASVSFAVSGIVACNVDSTGGPIRPGDLLVSSPVPGFAMRSDAPVPGTVLGKALETLPAGTGTIRVLVVLR